MPFYSYVREASTSSIMLRTRVYPAEEALGSEVVYLTLTEQKVYETREEKEGGVIISEHIVSRGGKTLHPALLSLRLRPPLDHRATTGRSDVPVVGFAGDGAFGSSSRETSTRLASARRSPGPPASRETRLWWPRRSWSSSLLQQATRSALAVRPQSSC